LPSSHKQADGAALMVGGPSFRIKPTRTKQLAKIAAWHAAEASQRLGWTSKA
jgi:hypothetical protein